MKYYKIFPLLVAMLFVSAFLPVFSQSATSAPSKFDMKKDGDVDGGKNKNDKCASTPSGGAVDGTGCPVDNNKDGEADYLETCPTNPSTAGMNGCQDKDKDG